MFKTALFDGAINEKCRVSSPGIWHPRQKKLLMPGGQPGRRRGVGEGGCWAQLELTDALSLVFFRLLCCVGDIKLLRS